MVTQLNKMLYRCGEHGQRAPPPYSCALTTSTQKMTPPQCAAPWLLNKTECCTHERNTGKAPPPYSRTPTANTLKMKPTQAANPVATTRCCILEMNMGNAPPYSRKPTASTQKMKPTQDANPCLLNKTKCCILERNMGKAPPMLSYAHSKQALRR